MPLEFSLTALPLAQLSAGTFVDADSVYGEVVQATSGFGTLGVAWLIFTQLLLIIAYWLASKAVSRKKNGVMLAVKLWLVNTLGLAVVAGVIATGVYLSRHEASGSLFFASFFVGTLLAVTLLLSTPLWVYSIGFGRVIGFWICVMVLNAAGHLALTRAVALPAGITGQSEIFLKIAQLPWEVKKQLIGRLTGKETTTPGITPADEKLAANRSRPIEERFAAVQRIYAEMEARRLALNTEDAAAVAAYTRGETRYKELLASIQADASAEQTRKEP